jgi:hypothetical protein
MTDYWEPHSDGDSARRSMRSNDCSNRACGLPVKFWDQPPFAAARAQAGGLTAPMTTPAWEFCCDWYRPDEIERSIAESFWRPSALGARPPENILSREFAEWLCDQYRLAMNKGIQVGKSQADSSLAAENATLKEQLAAKERECERLQAWHDIENEVCGVFSFQLDRIREHRGEDGKISGDGRWRIEEIWGCIQKMIAAEDRANFKMDEWTKQNEALNIAPAAEGGGK